MARGSNNRYDTGEADRKPSKCRKKEIDKAFVNLKSRCPIVSGVDELRKIIDRISRERIVWDLCRTCGGVVGEFELNAKTYAVCINLGIGSTWQTILEEWFKYRQGPGDSFSELVIVDPDNIAMVHYKVGPESIFLPINARARNLAPVRIDNPERLLGRNFINPILGGIRRNQQEMARSFDQQAKALTSEEEARQKEKRDNFWR